MREGFRTFRVDKNQPEIVRTFRMLGYAVAHTHQAGDGFPDIVVSKHGLNMLVEIKDGSKVPSSRMLNPAQRQFHFLWPGMICVITRVEDVMVFDKSFKGLVERMREAGIVPAVKGCEDPIYFKSLI